MAAATTAPDSNYQASGSSASDWHWHGYRTADMPQLSSWVEPLGRVGHAAKGIVYGIVGLMAFRLAVGLGGSISGVRGAIEKIGQQPFGQLLLWATAIGLLSYTAWRLVQAIYDTEGAGRNFRGIGRRIGYAISGLIYGVLGIFAANLAIGARRSSSGQSSSDEAQQTLLQSFGGSVLIGLIGAVIIGIGLQTLYKAYKASFMRELSLREMSEKARRAALHIGRMGLSTRGIAFVIIGGFLIAAATGYRHAPSDGLADALAFVSIQPFGKILLGVAGFGLTCYAAHMIIMAIYRHFNVRRAAA